MEAAGGRTLEENERWLIEEPRSHIEDGVCPGAQGGHPQTCGVEGSR